MSSFEAYYNQNIAKQIRKYRIAMGLTQEELSDMLSKNLKYIGHVERCERVISTKMLTLLLEIFKVQPVEFYKFEIPYVFNK